MCPFEWIQIVTRSKKQNNQLKNWTHKRTLSIYVYYISQRIRAHTHVYIYIIYMHTHTHPEFPPVTPVAPFGGKDLLRQKLRSTLRMAAEHGGQLRNLLFLLDCLVFTYAHTHTNTTCIYINMCVYILHKYVYIYTYNIMHVHMTFAYFMQHMQMKQTWMDRSSLASSILGL